MLYPCVVRRIVYPAAQRFSIRSMSAREAVADMFRQL